ncbi:MAG: TetR/AcrR family transcriptional regulator [Oscillospiraceae bacterium]|nr:TetR/AcrR family transcriptional regulator [Oscillospiraceae bacterium]
MAQFTKQAIIQTFIMLLNEKPFDKITVTDIVERCGINRNTFYYYYSDIYALIDELFKTETQKIINANKEFNTWQEGFFEATGFALENKKAIFHIYNSMNRDVLEKYIYDVTKNNMTQFVQKQAEGLDASKEDINAISAFYTAALVGLVTKWLQDGMKDNPEPFIERLGILLEGDIRAALLKTKQSIQTPRTV